MTKIRNFIYEKFFNYIKEPGYLKKTGGLYFVGAASSRDRFNSRLEAAPTGVFLVIWTFRISR
jgi:hypothetical protein